MSRHPPASTPREEMPPRSNISRSRSRSLLNAYPADWPHAVCGLHAVRRTAAPHRLEHPIRSAFQGRRRPRIRPRCQARPRRVRCPAFRCGACWVCLNSRSRSLALPAHATRPRHRFTAARATTTTSVRMARTTLATWCGARATSSRNARPLQNAIRTCSSRQP